MTTLKLHPAPGVRAGSEVRSRPAVRRHQAEPRLDATDPRWVLAVRTATEMQGPLLTPEKRRKLLRLAKVMGLRPFDANLIIAIVQDQARRGVPALSCPAEGMDQLAMVVLPPTREPSAADRWRKAALVAAVIAVEAAVIAVLV